MWSSLLGRKSNSMRRLSCFRTSAKTTAFSCLKKTPRHCIFCAKRNTKYQAFVCQELLSFCYVICADKDLCMLESKKAELLHSYWKHVSLLILFWFLELCIQYRNPLLNHLYLKSIREVVMEWTLKLFWFSNFSFPSCLTYYSFWELAFKKKKKWLGKKNNVMPWKMFASFQALVFLFPLQFRRDGQALL